MSNLEKTTELGGSLTVHIGDALSPSATIEGGFAGEYFILTVLLELDYGMLSSNQFFNYAILFRRPLLGFPKVLRFLVLGTNSEVA